MYILDPANTDHSSIVKVLFVRIHDGSCWKEVEEFVSSWVGALKILGNTLNGVIFYSHYNFLKELSPLVLGCLTSSLYN
jgi:hypothetical protein